MKNNRTPLKEILDDNVLYEIRFVKKDGKLNMVSKKSVYNVDQSTTLKPMFPISKDRR